MNTLLRNSILLILTVLALSFCPVRSYSGESGTVTAQDLMSDDKIDEAEAVLNKEILTNPKDASALSLLGEVFRKKRDYKKAVKYLDKAIEADPGYPISYMYKGRVYFAMQRFDEVPAEFALFMANMKPLINDVETKDFYISSLHDISMIYFELKKYDELKSVVDEILRLSPKDQTALYNLGVYYYVYDRNRSSAYRYFSRAIDVDDSTPTAAKAKYAIEFMRINPDSRVSPDFSFIDQEYKS